MVDETNVDRDEGDYRKPGRKNRQRKTTLRAQNGKMVSSSKGKREVLVEHYSKIGTPKPEAKFDAEFEK